MRRVTAICGVVLVLAGVGPVSATASVTGVGGSDPGVGAISAGVYFYSGGWSGRHSPCSWTPFSGDTALDHRQGGPVLTRPRNGVIETAYVRECPGGDSTLVWIAPADPPALSRGAAKELAKLLPKPKPHGAPSLDLTFVTVGTWLWTDTLWGPRSVTAWVPTVNGSSAWATTTATPTGIRFDPGDGSDIVECEGPGTAWTEAEGDDGVSDCMVVYQHSSAIAANGESFTGELSIVWNVAWRSSTGASGTLDPIVGVATVPVTVREIQAVGTS